MTVINQSPPGQTSVSLSVLNIEDTEVSGDSYRDRRNLVGAESEKLALGGSMVEPPTTGQIWPLGFV